MQPLATSPSGAADDTGRDVGLHSRRSDPCRGLLDLAYRRAGEVEAVTAWYEDLPGLVSFARWLYGRGKLTRGGDWLAFFTDPRAWLVELGEGDLHAVYEAELGLAL